jgi:hypothetical protein
MTDATVFDAGDEEAEDVVLAVGAVGASVCGEGAVSAPRVAAGPAISIARRAGPS